MRKQGTRKATARRPSVKDRASAIVADAERYDADTRESIRHMLETGDADLAQSVERAEAGESICDLTRLAEPEPRAAARRLIERDIRDLQGKPDFRPIPYAQAEELAGKIITQDDDVRAFALITLLQGIAAAYFAHSRGDTSGPDVESLVYMAVRGAYMKTTIFQYAVREFINLPPGTVEAMEDRGLRKEVIEEVRGQAGDKS